MVPAARSAPPSWRRRQPDGYTLLYGTPGPLITNRFLMQSLPYDPDKDFAPVSLLTKGAYLMVVNKDLSGTDGRGGYRARQVPARRTDLGRVRASERAAIWRVSYSASRPEVQDVPCTIPVERARRYRMWQAGG